MTEGKREFFCFVCYPTNEQQQRAGLAAAAPTPVLLINLLAFSGSLGAHHPLVWLQRRLANDVAAQSGGNVLVTFSRGSSSPSITRGTGRYYHSHIIQISLLMSLRFPVLFDRDGTLLV